MLSKDPPDEAEISSCKSIIRKEIENIFLIEEKSDEVIAVAGTPTTLACIKKGLTNYNESKIEGDILTREDLSDFTYQLALLSSRKIKEQYNSVVNGREDVLFTGTLLLSEIMNHLNINKFTVSTRGVRYGAIIQYLQNLS